MRLRSMKLKAKKNTAKFKQQVFEMAFLTSKANDLIRFEANQFILGVIILTKLDLKLTLNGVSSWCQAFHNNPKNCGQNSSLQTALVGCQVFSMPIWLDYLSPKQIELQMLYYNALKSIPIIYYLEPFFIRVSGHLYTFYCRPITLLIYQLLIYRTCHCFFDCVRSFVASIGQLHHMRPLIA